LKNLSGNHVSKVWRVDDVIYKEQPKYLCDNEWHALSFLAATTYVPAAERLDDELIKMQFLVSQTEPINEVLFRENCDAFLCVLFNANLRHGDLTEPHIFVVDNSPVVIDWAESRMEDDPRPDKRREGDSYWLDRSIDRIVAKQQSR